MRATVVWPDKANGIEFEIHKTKGGKFTYATMKNLEQLLEIAATGTGQVILAQPVETDRWLTMAITQLREERRLVDLVKYFRDWSSGSLVAVHNCIRRYINPTWHRTAMDLGLNRLLSAKASGLLMRQIAAFTRYYAQNERSTEMEQNCMKGEVNL